MLVIRENIMDIRIRRVVVGWKCNDVICFFMSCVMVCNVIMFFVNLFEC